MWSAGSRELCQLGIEADVKPVTESNLSLRVPAQVAAVQHDWRSLAAFQTSAPELVIYALRKADLVRACIDAVRAAGCLRQRPIALAAPRCLLVVLCQSGYWLGH